jgi:large exoprotein involved in heme utilization and adhesion
LALLGGEVLLTGGNLTAEAGRVELWSVKNGELSVNFDGSQLRVNSQPTTATTEFADINLTQAASIDTSGNRSGEIQMQGRQIGFADGSIILALTQGNETGGNINIRAAESMEVTGISPITLITSGLFPEVVPGATGAGGNLTIETGRLLVTDGGQIALGTLGFGNSGDLIVKANSIELIGGSPVVGPTGLFSLSNGQGNGGNLILETDRLLVSDGAKVATDSLSSGNAGNLNVSANESIEIIGISPFGFGSSSLTAQVQLGSGTGGNLTIETNRLLLADGGQVASGTFSDGNGGNLRVRANQVEVIGESVDGEFPSNLRTSSEGQGDGGDLTIETTSLLVADGGQIAASTGGAGNAGTLRVEAEEVELVGRGSQGSSGLFASAIIRQNQPIDPSALPPELANIDPSTFDPSALPPELANIDPSTFDPNSLPPELANIDPSTFDPNSLPPELANIDPSSIPSPDNIQGGNGGNIEITTDRLIVRDGATVSVSNFPSSQNSTALPGTGAAGDIKINASSLVRLNNEALVTADTQQGNNANITVTSPDIVLRQGSQITTNSTQLADGGNITLTTDNLVSIGNSDITANAEVLNGGQVIINADALFGIQFRDRLTPESDITATGGVQGVAGTVEINTPEVDPAAGLIQLASSPIDVTALLGDDLCSPEVLANSSFIITGRGGIPPTPTDPLIYQPISLEWARPYTGLPARGGNFSYAPMSLPVNSSVNSSVIKSENFPLLEAQGWVQKADGTIILTAQPGTVTPDGSGFTHPGCR